VAGRAGGPQDDVPVNGRSGADRGFLPIRVTNATLRALKTSESVARDIVDDIVVNGLGEGASLPAESAMLQQYGVSRETLREALRLLEVQGLISIRRGPGGGPIVGVVDPANLGRVSTLYYHLAGATYAELFEAWVVSERIIAELAAGNPDRRLVRDAMTPFLDPHGPEQEALDEFVVRHTEFHAVVGSLARNKVLQLSLMAMGQVVTHHVALNADPRAARDTIEHDHAAIAKAIVSGFRTKARDLMEEHLRAIAEFYQRELGPQMSDFIDWR
jgi:GntR family transcriptional regulator, transcriptional repressor for pyruvate dehydrogenase complex